MDDESFRAEYRIIFRCSVCSEGKESLEKLEAHLWNCHLREFPYRCALCGYPSLSSKTLCLHFEQVHDRTEPVLFKRSIVNELRLREMISRSLFFPMEEPIFDSIAVPSNAEGPLERLTIEAVENPITIETPYETMTVDGFTGNVVEEEIVDEDIGQSTRGNVVAVEDNDTGNVYVAHNSYSVYNDDEYGIHYIDDNGNRVDTEELLAEDDGFQETLLSHQARINGGQSSTFKSSNKARRRATIHQCEDCGKILKYPSKIAEHRRSHTKEKPHSCSECGASFSQKGALKCHLRLHTGERPYACTWECGRSFVSASARQMHEKMHTGEKRFVCSICGHLFSKKFHMQRHMSTLHRNHNDEVTTGLDAAGEDARVLAQTVTSVIEDVRSAKLKRKKKPPGSLNHMDLFCTNVPGTHSSSSFDTSEVGFNSVLLGEWTDSEEANEFCNNGKYTENIIYGGIMGHNCMPGTSENSSENSVNDDFEEFNGNTKQSPTEVVQCTTVEGDMINHVAASPAFSAKRDTTIKRNLRKKATVVQCEYCGIITKHPSKIQAHLRTHTGEKPFECLICGMRFTQRTPMRMHVRRHLRETPFVCSFGCGKSYVSNALKNAHELKVHLKKQKSKNTTTKSRIKPSGSSFFNDNHKEISLVPLRHLDSQLTHGSINPSNNNQSSLEANKKLDEVINAVAAGISLEPPKKVRRRSAVIAECQECGLVLKHPSKIKAHMRIHTGEKPFQCQFCGMRFTTASPLRVHFRRVHTGEKPFECTWKCGRRFVSISARNEHQRVVHAGVKRYQCTVKNCCRLFTRRHYLRLHQKKDHNIEDVFNCFSQCFTSFGYKRLNLNKKNLFPSYTVGLSQTSRVFCNTSDPKAEAVNVDLDDDEEFVTFEGTNVFEEVSDDNIEIVTKIDNDKTTLWAGSKKEAMADLKNVQFNTSTGEWLEFGEIDDSHDSECKQLVTRFIEPEMDFSIKNDVDQVMIRKGVANGGCDENTELNEMLDERSVPYFCRKLLGNEASSHLPDEVILLDDMSPGFNFRETYFC